MFEKKEDFVSFNIADAANVHQVHDHVRNSFPFSRLLISDPPPVAGEDSRERDVVPGVRGG